ncbi:hypothetical protein [Clostridium sp.]|jgi:uncharacterized membrane protein YciS (DUF1049 family)
MSFWSIMNWITWLLCGVFFLLIVIDFIKVEKERKQQEHNN